MDKPEFTADLSQYPPLAGWYALMNDAGRDAFVRLIRDQRADALAHGAACQRAGAAEDESVCGSPETSP